MEKSDPARELVAMCKWFSSFKCSRSNAKTIEAFSELFQTDSRSVVMKIISGAYKRFDDFEELVERIPDEDLYESDRKDISKAISKLRSFLDFEKFSNTWSNYIAISSDQVSLNAVKIASPVLARSNPSVIPSSEEVADLSRALDDIDEKDIAEAKLSEIFEEAVRRGIEDLKLNVRYPAVFGLENLYKKAFSLLSILMSTHKFNPEIEKSKIWQKCFLVLGLLYNIWLTPLAIEQSSQFNIDKIKEIQEYVDDHLGKKLIEYKGENK